MSARRRAEEFAQALTLGGRVAGETQSSVRAGQPAVRREVAELVGVVTRMQAHAPVLPRPGFTEDLRSRLMAEAETTLGADAAEARRLVLPPRPRGRRERRLVAAACAFVLIGGSAGMAAAAQSALPGQALYPIKRGIEHARAGLAFSQAAKGHDLLAQADDRLVEVRGLLSSASEGSAASTWSTAALPGTVRDFTSSARQGAALLMASYRDDGDQASVVTVRRFAARDLATVRSLAADAPPQTKAALSHAAQALAAIDRSAHALCPSCAPNLPPLAVPQILLTAAQVRHALQEAAGENLDNSHPVVVPRGAVPSARAKADAKPHRHHAGDRQSSQGGAQGGSAVGPSAGVSIAPAPHGGTGGQGPSAGVPSLPLVGGLTDGGLLGGPAPSSAPSSSPTENSQPLSQPLSGLETLLPDVLDQTALPDLSDPLL
ncbi:MAG TPA: DUF5667 domain-containing protein [Nocardioidaceae bacterium]|nr:DUF5667 domain-containing protein [Nocardioidaceae bacterium]